MKFSETKRSYKIPPIRRLSHDLEMSRRWVVCDDFLRQHRSPPRHDMPSAACRGPACDATRASIPEGPLRKSAVVDFVCALRSDHLAAASHEGVEHDLARMGVIVLRGGHEGGEPSGTLRLDGAEQLVQDRGPDVAPAAMMRDLDEAEALQGVAVRSQG